MDGQLAAFISCRFGEENCAGNVGSKRRRGHRQIGRIRVLPVLHARLVAADQRRGHPLDKGEIAHFFAAHQRLTEDLGRFLIRLAGVVYLEVFFGRIMRIADPPIDKICIFGDYVEPLQLSRSENIFDLSKYESLHFLVRVVYHRAGAAPTDGKALKSS